MVKKVHLAIVVFFVSVILAALFVIFLKQDYVVIGNEKINVEISDTPEEMQKGLMFRKSLCPDCGMLFVFSDESIHSFWMKNTLIPLQMIFISAELKVVDVLDAVPCFEDPCRLYSPSKNSLYVMEVNKDRFDKSIIGESVKTS